MEKPGRDGDPGCGQPLGFAALKLSAYREIVAGQSHDNRRGERTRLNFGHGGKKAGVRHCRARSIKVAQGT